MSWPRSSKILAAGGCLAFLALAVGALPQDSRRVVRDDFSGAEISSENWYVCRRPENSFSLVDHQGKRAVRTFMRPPDARILEEKHRACLEEGEKYKPQNDLRAEIWEQQDLKLPYGTEVWIAFSFFVSEPPKGAEVPNIVVGQVKQEGGLRPVLAQRFGNRRFVVTIAQEDKSPRSDPDGCSVVVASSERSNPATACKRDLEFTQLGVLPTGFNRWIRMTYRFKLGIQDGLLDIWADGKPIATIRGRIGYPGQAGARQYFKFGPYNNTDLVSYELEAFIAGYRRGFSRADVEN